MIGQQSNIDKITAWRLNRALPRFILISGEGERLELAKVIGKTLKATQIIVNKSVKDVREVINNSYAVADTTVYIFEDGDTMSSAATNAILKVTEEPPNNAYFIILCKSEFNTLETIRSRSTHLKLEPYSKKDLQQLTDNELLLKYCYTPAQIKEWVHNIQGFEKLVTECENLVTSIGTMSGVELFRHLEKIKVKEDTETGYDPILFITICQELAFHKIIHTEHTNEIFELIKCCSEAKRDLAKTGVKKDSTFDMWLLNFKEVLK